MKKNKLELIFFLYKITLVLALFLLFLGCQSIKSNKIKKIELPENFCKLEIFEPKEIEHININSYEDVLSIIDFLKDLHFINKNLAIITEICYKKTIEDILKVLNDANKNK